MFIIPDNNKWSCMPAAFSMACGVPFQDFVAMIGHDGSDRPYKDKSIRRGFHWQECVDAAWKLGFATTNIERVPAARHTMYSDEILEIYSEDAATARFLHYLSLTKRGVLQGVRPRQDGTLTGHACAWDGTLIFDPSHRTYTYEDSKRNNFHVTGLLILTEVCHGKE